jgi:hypothetical protein
MLISITTININMPRKKLSNKRTEMIQVMVFPEDKVAFDRWCAANSTTMSDIIRRQIAPYVESGRRLKEDLEERSAG